MLNQAMFLFSSSSSSSSRGTTIHLWTVTSINLCFPSAPILSCHLPIFNPKELPSSLPHGVLPAGLWSSPTSITKCLFTRYSFFGIQSSPISARCSFVQSRCITINSNIPLSLETNTIDTVALSQN